MTKNNKSLKELIAECNSGDLQFQKTQVEYFRDVPYCSLTKGDFPIPCIYMGICAFKVGEEKYRRCQYMKNLYRINTKR